MTEVEITLTIARPPEEVFAFIADFEKNSLWQQGVKKAWITSEGPFGVGTTYTQLSRFLGRDIEFHFEVIGYEPGRRVEFRTVSGTFPVHIVREVEPAAGATRVHAVIQGEAGGIFRLATPLLNQMTRRQIEGDYARLKELLEAEEA
jgi:uncharacterized protein YndB with AHSA1/START domain